MSLELDIPDEQFDAKPFYRNRDAAEAVLTEIREHIKKTGEPHTWRHHTHSKPVKGSRIVYLGRFDLPSSHQAPDRYAPCPCCSPRAPKYSRDGKIAWFPDEHVIRIIGPDCFQTLNPEGHWAAVEQFDREEAEKRTISYLLQNLHLAAKIRGTILAAEPTLTAIDQVHEILRKRIEEFVRVDLWRQVNRGVLNVHVEGRRMRRARDGAEEAETFLDIQGLSPFPSYKMFSPKGSNLAARIKACAKRLSFLEFGEETQERVRTLAQADRTKAAKMLSTGLNTARNIFAEAEIVRNGFTALSVATLRGWTRHRGCPVQLYIDGDDRNFYIGVAESQRMRIEISETFWRSFGELPNINTDIE